MDRFIGHLFSIDNQDLMEEKGSGRQIQGKMITYGRDEKFGNQPQWWTVHYSDVLVDGRVWVFEYDSRATSPHFFKLIEVRDRTLNDQLPEPPEPQRPVPPKAVAELPCPVCRRGTMEVNRRDFFECGSCHVLAAAENAMLIHRRSVLMTAGGKCVWVFPVSAEQLDLNDLVMQGRSGVGIAADADAVEFLRQMGERVRSKDSRP